MFTKNDILWEPIITLEEKPSDYYTSEYDSWRTKDQIQIWAEVKKPKEYNGSFDTADSSITTVNNVYTLSVATPTSKIFSIGIDGNTKTFQWASYWAYATLETQLQAWLWATYTVTYVSGTNYTLYKYDGSTITLTHPNLVRKVVLSSFDTDSKIDVIIDGTTISLLGSTHSGSAATAFTYLITQLPWSTYYAVVEGSDLVIARIDWAIPSITKTQYHRYTYRMNFNYVDTAAAWQFWDYTNTTIDGTTYYVYGTQARPYRGDKIIRDLNGYTWSDAVGASLSSSHTDNAENGWTIYARENQTLNTVTKDGSCTATRALLKSNWGTTLSTVSFSGNTATFNYTLAWNTSYRIVVDNNGSNYTTRDNASYSFPYSWDFIDYTASQGTRWGCIASVNCTTTWPSGYTQSVVFNKSSWWSDSSWTSANESVYFNMTHYFNIHKTDYSTMSFSVTNHYTVPWSYPDDSTKYSLTTTDHYADITVSTYTEITITLAVTSKNYFIPVWFNPTYITMNAKSANGTSNWTWGRNITQSCTTKYSTTAIVSGKIFKTDASNYGNIISITMAWFIISWTTNTSNKIDFYCTK